MIIATSLATAITRFCFTEPYRQVHPIETSRFARYLQDRGVNLDEDTLVYLWKAGFLRPICLSDPPPAELPTGRFEGVPLSKDGPFGPEEDTYYLDTGAAPDSVGEIPSWQERIRVEGVWWHPFQFFQIVRMAPYLTWRPAANLLLQRDEVAHRWFAEDREGSRQGLVEWNNSPERLESEKVLALLLYAEPIVRLMLTKRLTYESWRRDDSNGYFPWREAEWEKAPSVMTELGLTLDDLKRWYERICWQASHLDPVSNLRPLLRHASSEQRDKMSGDALKADSLYYAAETLRRYAENFHDAEWPEEDDNGALGAAWSNERLYGSKRLYDNDRNVFRRLVRHFDLDPQARVTWFLEGATEEAFLRQYVQLSLGDIHQTGIELMNLEGIGGLKDNRLRLLLERFAREEVFTFITIDHDNRADHVRMIQRYRSDELLSAGFRIWEPDFEQANFTLEELAQVAMGVAGAAGIPMTISATEIQKVMDTRHLPVGKAIVNLWGQGKVYGGKGPDWGRALAVWALDHECPASIAWDGMRPILRYLTFRIRDASASNYWISRKLLYIDDDGQPQRRPGVEL